MGWDPKVAAWKRMVPVRSAPVVLAPIVTITCPDPVPPLLESCIHGAEAVAVQTQEAEVVDIVSIPVPPVASSASVEPGVTCKQLEPRLKSMLRPPLE